MVNDIVNKVYVITVVDSERKDYIYSHLKQYNIEFEFFVAPEYNIISPNSVVDTPVSDCRPAISLISSYVSLFEMSNINNYESICIIEDDCFLLEDWERNLIKFYNKIPNDNWDVLHVGYHPLHDSNSVLKNINEFVNSPLEWHHTTHMMLCKSSIYTEYINLVKQFEYTYPVDYIFNEIYKQQKYNCYCPVEKIAYQLSERDDEIKHNVGPIRFKSSVL